MKRTYDLENETWLPKTIFPEKMKKTFCVVYEIKSSLDKFISLNPYFWKLSYFSLSDLPPDVFGYRNFLLCYQKYLSLSLSLFYYSFSLHIHLLLQLLFALMTSVLAIRTKCAILDIHASRGLLFLRKGKAIRTWSKMKGKVYGESVNQKCKNLILHCTFESCWE